MDINPPEPAKMDDRAIRVRTLIVIIAAFRYFGESPTAPVTTSFIVPSQSVRW